MDGPYVDMVRSIREAVPVAHPSAVDGSSSEPQKYARKKLRRSVKKFLKMTIKWGVPPYVSVATTDGLNSWSCAVIVSTPPGGNW